MREVIRHLRRAALLHKGDGPTDGQLLESFIVRREETAFEALLHRHGPMVLGVCQRILRNVHDAEDAFQATFLVLARKASSVMPREMVGHWLYGVAFRTAMKARAMSIKRREKEKQAAETSRPAGEACEGLLAQLDQELSRLPTKYRVPIVLCELEGKSRKEVARLLGLPEGTLSSRLAQAKKMLAKRLSRRELTIPLGALAVGMSPTLRASTLKTALTAGAVPAKVLALTEGVIKAMLLTKLKITACAGALMLVAGVGAMGLTYRATADEPKQVEFRKVYVTRTDNRPATDELEAFRLEIEALRKSLQATRERVKTLEGEVSALKGLRQGQQGTKPGAGEVGRPGTQPSGPTSGAQHGPAGQGVGGPPSGIGPSTSLPQSGLPQGMRWLRKRTPDPVADAEAALKKLRENPGDKQATEALERALQRLKERDKQNQPGETPNR